MQPQLPKESSDFSLIEVAAGLQGVWAEVERRIAHARSIGKRRYMIVITVDGDISHVTSSDNATRVDMR